MNTGSKGDKRFMPPMSRADVTVVETANIDRIIEALIVQNGKLLDLVSSILAGQAAEKAAEWAHRRERERRQDEVMDTIKPMLPVLLDYLKPSQPPPGPKLHTGLGPAEPRAHAAKERAGR